MFSCPNSVFLGPSVFDYLCACAIFSRTRSALGSASSTLVHASTAPVGLYWSSAGRQRIIVASVKVCFGPPPLVKGPFDVVVIARPELRLDEAIPAPIVLPVEGYRVRASSAALPYECCAWLPQIRPAALSVFWRSHCGRRTMPTWQRRTRQGGLERSMRLLKKFIGSCKQ